MRRAFVACIVGLCACDCGASHGVELDASMSDVHLIDAGEHDAGLLPPVAPTSPRCDELDAPEDRVCVDHGWFWMARWSTMTALNGRTEVPGLPRPRQPVFLETYLIDRTEVTVEAYGVYAAATGAEPPPERCGYEDRDLPYPASEYTWVPEESVMDDSRSDHPVVCVTRAEAAAFCAWREGRLPTVAEWMRAGQEPYPTFRRFPWGDTPPPPDDASWFSANFDAFSEEYLVFGRNGGSTPLTSPAGSRERGASPAGVYDLAGNASEILSECAEELSATYGDDSAPLVRPSSTAGATCSEAVLVGGASWRGSDNVDLGGSQTLWSMVDGENGFSPLEGDRDAVGIGAFIERMWGEARPVDETVPADGAGNERRSWRIGFRCAYDP